jgi:hypothetical protein
MNATKIIPLVLALVGILGAQTASAHTQDYWSGFRGKASYSLVNVMNKKESNE